MPKPKVGDLYTIALFSKHHRRSINYYCIVVSLEDFDIVGGYTVKIVIGAPAFENCVNELAGEVRNLDTNFIHFTFITSVEPATEGN